jgi:adenosylcobinamide-GDP ribazoletransferase
MLKSFSAALSFLTIFRIPSTVPIMSREELASGVASFPLAGLILGLIYYGAGSALNGRVPCLLLSVLIASLTVLLTRGLHFDGLADLADGIWGGSTPERRLEIMKDSRSGAFGVLALVLAVSFKIASIDALISRDYLVPLLLAPVFSRFAMAVMAYGSQCARKDGLGKLFLEDLKIEQVAIAAALTAATVLPAGFKPMLYFIPVLGCVFLFRLISRKYLGGITGDVLGALNEVSEIVVLALGACAVSR